MVKIDGRSKYSNFDACQIGVSNASNGRTHIIENLSNSLNHGVGALKKDEVKQNKWFTIWWFLKTFEAKGQPQKFWVLISDSYTR